MATRHGVEAEQVILQVQDKSISNRAVSLCTPLCDDETVLLAAGEASSAAGRTALQPSCTRRAQPHAWRASGSRARRQESWGHRTPPAQLSGRGPLRETSNRNFLSNVTAS